jgi:hypothetical protein
MFLFTRICFLAVFALICPSAQHPKTETYKYSVAGRVVDSKGNPVAAALLTLEPVLPSDLTDSAVDRLVDSYETDSEGRFYITVSTIVQVSDWALYIEAPRPAKSYAPIHTPFDNLSDTKKSSFRQIITLKEGQLMNLRDVPVKLYYCLTILQIHDRANAPMLTSRDKWEHLWLRIRDERGDIVSEGNLSRRNIDEAVHPDSSSVSMALPEGIWSVEVSLDSIGENWFTSNSPVSLERAHNPLPVTIRIARENIGKRALPSDVAFAPELARQQLEGLGILYSQESFIERAVKGNTSALQLFLLAGMNPNVRDKNGSTALIIASEQGYNDCVSLLLSKKADLNSQNNNGLSALMLAAVTGRTRIVADLLTAGADIKIQDKNGKTALMLAEEHNKDDVIWLIKARAQKPR